MSFTRIQGRHTRDSMRDKPMVDMIYSFGIAHPGAVVGGVLGSLFTDVEVGFGDSGLDVHMVGMIILPSLLPKTLNLSHFHFCVNGVAEQVGIHFPDLVHESVCLDETVVLSDFLCVS